MTCTPIYIDKAYLIYLPISIGVHAGYMHNTYISLPCMGICAMDRIDDIGANHACEAVLGPGPCLLRAMPKTSTQKLRRSRRLTRFSRAKERCWKPMSSNARRLMCTLYALYTYIYM